MTLPAGPMRMVNPLPTRPCLRCGRPTPVFRMALEDVRRNGWIPFLPTIVVHWCGQGQEVLPIPNKDGTCDLGVGDWGSVVGVNNGPADVRRHSDSCPPHRAARRRGAAAAENVTHRGFRSGQPYHVLGAV